MREGGGQGKRCSAKKKNHRNRVSRPQKAVLEKAQGPKRENQLVSIGGKKLEEGRDIRGKE